MIALYLIIGIIIGGVTLKFGGALAGGIIGLLTCWLFDLQGRCERLEREVSWLRSRYAEGRRTVEVAPPSTAVQQAPQVTPNSVPPHSRDEINRAIPAPAPLPTRPITPHPETEMRTAVNHNVQASNSPAVDDTSGEFPFAGEIRKFFSGENLLVKLGVMILIFGVSFLVKYAAQHGLFPIELRLASTALGGVALLTVGWRVRGTRPVYGQVIQGGGIAILYLTIYAAMRLYHLVPTVAGFILLVAICALSATLAVAQDSRSLAVMGSAGGFLAPELASIGSGSPAILFGYYAVLNTGILAIARLRAWRELNLLGFVGTFIISALWGSRFYAPQHFLIVEPFLVIFFLMYALLPILYSGEQKNDAGGQTDVTLIFGTPIVAFALQAALVRHYEYGLAWSALAAGVFYIATAGCLLRYAPERMRNPAEAFLSLGTVFCSLAIPLAFDNRWTSAAWSIEGAALVWTGLRQDRRPARLFGYLLLIGSGIFFLDTATTSGPLPVLNSFYIGCLLVCSGALFSARQLSRNRFLLIRKERYAEPLLFAWGLLWWYASGLREIWEQTDHSYLTGVVLLFIALSSFVCIRMRKRTDWQLAEWPALGLLPALVVLGVHQLILGDSYPSLHGGWFGWPAAVACWYLILRQVEQCRVDLHAIFHAASLWLTTLLLSWEIYGRISALLLPMTTWAVCAWVLVPTMVVLVIARRRDDLPWPVKGRYREYLETGAFPLALLAWFWLLWANLTSSGDPWPLPYVPVINPLDGTSMLILITLTCYWQKIRAGLPDIGKAFSGVKGWAPPALTAFFWLNALLLRTIHHWCHVPFNASDLFGSLTVQAVLSIFWSLLALVVMTVATKQGLREVWLAGATLLGTVVVKLFLIDLAGHGSMARIITFVSVGLLILLIGWFSPAPPHSTTGEGS